MFGLLGGAVEFGETLEAALIREFKEELGVTVRALGPPVFIENLFTHDGQPGHEILAIFDVVFPPDAFITETRIAFQEDDGAKCEAEWFDVEKLDLPERPQLFPAGLKARLQGRWCQCARSTTADQDGSVTGQAR